MDQRDSNGWRGASIPGCPSRLCLLPTGDLQCPRWCVTFKDGDGRGRTACFGRVHPTEILHTVVGRAEPHNLRIAHPTQDRVLTIREMARAQVRGEPGTGRHHRACSQEYMHGRRHLHARYQMVSLPFPLSP